MINKITLAALAALGLAMPTVSQAAFLNFSDDGTTITYNGSSTDNESTNKQ